MKNIEKILNFNGKEIPLILAGGQWWIAIRPICEALNVSYKGQIERIERHHFLSQLTRKYGSVAADKKTRDMLCISERYVYGWLMGINSDSPELIEYQKECYDILFNHFHGRFSALIERVQIDEEISSLEARLSGNEQYEKIKDLTERRKRIAPALRKMDADLIKGQIRLQL